jgi:hypothetical protein
MVFTLFNGLSQQNYKVVGNYNTEEDCDASVADLEEFA